ncbi:MAG: selenium cofactor biosynthesis protein YqeC [Elusimicrobiota bacterium]
MKKNMNYDQLHLALKLHHYRDVISIVGSGGKTSVLMRLGKELNDSKKRVILTTTTHIECLDFNFLRLYRELTAKKITAIEDSISNSPLIVAKRKVKGNRIKGLSTKQIVELNREIKFDYLVVEADSADKKSLTAHHKYEPSVPPCTTLYVVVIGYDAVGKKLNSSNVHHPRMIARITGKTLNSEITFSDIISLLKHPKGLLKARPPATRTVVLLNKIKDSHLNQAKNLAQDILKYGQGINSVICGEINKPHQLLLFT